MLSEIPIHPEGNMSSVENGFTQDFVKLSVVSIMKTVGFLVIILNVFKLHTCTILTPLTQTLHKALYSLVPIYLSSLIAVLLTFLMIQPPTLPITCLFRVFMISYKLFPMLGTPFPVYPTNSFKAQPRHLVLVECGLELDCVGLYPFITS